MVMWLASSHNPLRPDVYSAFYKLHRPAYGSGLIRAIQSGDMSMQGTSSEPSDL